MAVPKIKTHRQPMHSAVNIAASTALYSFEASPTKLP